MKKYDRRIIGQKAYLVKAHDKEIIELTITGFTVDLGGYHLIYSNKNIYEGWQDRIFLSEKKANNFLNDIIKREEVSKLRDIKNEEYIAKSEQFKTVSLQPTYKKGKYSFTTITNQYLTTREGKKWKFWTKLDELNDKLEKLQEQVKDVKKQIRYEEKILKEIQDEESNTI